LKAHVKQVHDDPKPKNMTRGEKAIYDCLLSTGYEFKKTFFREVTFNDLIGIGGNKLRYDFKVMIDEVKFVLIEFDGEQHFRPVNFGGGKTAQQILDDFKQTRTHDRIKDSYCTDNGIALLRIKYDQVDLSGVMITEFIRLNK
jgi:very-short-patch-repair endonuclease